MRKKSIHKVFSPTANEKSLKFLMALGCALELWTLSLDVYGAFLYADQKEEVFISIPASVTGGREVIWRLNKTMYGLDSSPRAFYDHATAHLMDGGYIRCTSDPCVFTKRRPDGNFLMTVVHVDDLWWPQQTWT